MAKFIYSSLLLFFVYTAAFADELDDSISTALNSYSQLITQAVTKFEYDQRDQTIEAIDKLYQASAKGLEISTYMMKKYPTTVEYFTFISNNYPKIKKYTDISVLDIDWKDNAKFKQAGISITGIADPTHLEEIETVKFLIILPIEVSILLQHYINNDNKILLEEADDKIDEINLYLKKLN